MTRGISTHRKRPSSTVLWMGVVLPACGLFALTGCPAGVPGGDVQQQPQDDQTPVKDNSAVEIAREIEEADIVKILDGYFYLANPYKGLRIIDARTPGQAVLSGGSNQTYGADAAFSFLQDGSLVGYYAKTRTRGLTGNDQSYQARLRYNGDEWGTQLDHLLVGDDFNPEIGFVQRRGFRQSSASVRWSPRPESIGWIRQLTFQGNFNYFENEQAGFVESRDAGGRFQIELENSDQFSVRFTDSYENLIQDTPISGAVIPAGRYSFRDVEVGYNFGSQRRMSGNVSVRRGTFYTGEITSVRLDRARIEILPQLSVEPSVEFNWIDLPDQQAFAGEFNQHVARTRVTYSLTPRTFLSGLVQYNSGTRRVSGNFRFRWEWAPGSEFFLVFTEERNTDILDRWSAPLNRGLVIKVNRLFRF